MRKLGITLDKWRREFLMVIFFQAKLVELFLDDFIQFFNNLLEVLHGFGQVSGL